MCMYGICVCFCLYGTFLQVTCSFHQFQIRICLTFELIYQSIKIYAFRNPDSTCWTAYYPPTKSEGYCFGVVRACVRPSIPSVRTFCLSGTISQYLLVRFNSFLVQMISTMNSRYPISLVKIDPLTLELLPLFKYRQL